MRQAGIAEDTVIIFTSDHGDMDSAHRMEHKTALYEQACRVPLIITQAGATPAGAIVESFTDPERDPLQAELFEDPPRIAHGRLTLKEAPGLGLTLSEAALKKFGERIL